MIKYCVGIDVSKKELHCCFCGINQSQKVTIKSSRKFSNNTEGFKELIQWVIKYHRDLSIPLFFVMEATGIYYENIAYFLFLKNYNVSVVLPNKAKKYLQATGIKSKNDTIDARGLAQMGAEQCLALWRPMELYFYELRELTRHYQSLQEHRTVLGNQIHAAEHGMHQIKLVAKHLKSMMQLLDKQLYELTAFIGKHLQKDKTVADKVDKICQIKGVGMLTVAVVLAETNGFELFTNSRQLVSYAGYDIVENQSGSHIGKTRISKKGNSRIRRCLHMPAFSVVRYEQKLFKNLFDRTLQKHGVKMKSYVAVQKKLLVLIYALWKRDQAYDPAYPSKLHTGDKEQAPSSLLALEQGGIENKIAPTKR